MNTTDQTPPHRLVQFATSDQRFGVLLGILLLALLIGVGFGVDTLPYPVNSPFSDVAISHWPSALYLNETIRAGYFPLWRDLLMNGQPFAANPLNKVWYPPQWAAILLPPALHLNLLIWLHLILAGIGMRALARRLGMVPGVAAFCGIAYALTPRLLAATGAGHLDIVYAAAWFPCVLWAAHYAVTADAPLVRRAAIVAACGAMCFLADMRLSVFALAAVGMLMAWLIADGADGADGSTPSILHTDSPSLQAEREAGGEANSRAILQRFSKRATLVLITGLLLLLLTAVQWVPLVTLAPELSRGGLTREDAAVFSLQPTQWIGLLVPDRAGSHETMLYVGIGLLVLAVLGLASALHRHAFWALLAGGAGWYALGSNGLLWSTVVSLFPPLLWLRVPSRIWIVGVLAIIVLAGFGVQALRERGFRRRRAVPLAGMALLGAGAASLPFVGALPAGAGMALVGGLLAMGVLLLICRRLTEAQITLIATALMVIDLIFMDTSLVKGQPPSFWLEPYAQTATALKEAGVTRLYSPDYSLPQQAAAAWHLPVFGGVDPFQFKDYVTAFEQASGTRLRGYSITLPPFEKGIARANADAIIEAETLARWSVSHVLAGYSIDHPDLKLVGRPQGLYLYENRQYPKNAQITWITPGEFMTVQAANGSEVPEINAVPVRSGWIVDGGSERGPITSRSSHARYQPLDQILAAVISAGGWCSVLFLYLWRGNRPDKRKDRIR